MDRGASPLEKADAGDVSVVAGSGKSPCELEEAQSESFVELGETFLKTVRHFWPELNVCFDALPDTRWFPLIQYEQRFLVWWGISLFAFKLGSRRQLDFDLSADGTHILTNMNRLASTEQETRPVHGTLDHYIGHLGAPPLADIRTNMVRRLIRMKALDEGRLQGKFVIAIDGTGYLAFAKKHCMACLVQKHESYTVYLHPVLEAKLVTPSGLALSVGTEFIENPADAEAFAKLSQEKQKQDCELKALTRLAPILKQAFPQTPFCLSGDSLYGCGASFQLAKDHGWSFFFTFKEGRMQAVWKEFQVLLKLSPENILRVEHQDGVLQEYQWINGMSYQDTEKRIHEFNALQCKETVDGKTTTFAWTTDFKITEKNVIRLAERGGRVRSKIENQGFNTQKNSALNLEHAYSTKPEHAKAYYYFLQIAHMILQLVELGSLLRRVANKRGKTPVQLFGSLKNIPRRLLEAFRFRFLPDEAFSTSAAASIRISLDTS